MIYNSAVSTNESSLLSSMLYITEAEGKMFDSLINIDFMDAITEADEEAAADGGNDAEEKKQNVFSKIGAVIKQICQRIWSILQTVGKAIGDAFKALGAKIGVLVGTNNGIVTKYGDYVKNQSNLEGFGGLQDYPLNADKLFQLSTNQIETNKKNIENIANYWNGRVAGLQDKSAEERKQVLEELDNKINNKENNETAEAQTGTFQPTVQFMIQVGNFLRNSSKIFDGLKSAETNALKVIKDAKADAKKKESEIDSKVKSGAGNDYAAGWKDYYLALSKCCKIVSRECSSIVSSTKSSVKYARRAMIEVGKYAYDKAKGKSPKKAKGEGEANAAAAPEDTNATTAEESMAFARILGLASDVYVESVFEI